MSDDASAVGAAVMQELLTERQLAQMRREHTETEAHEVAEGIGSVEEIVVDRPGVPRGQGESWDECASRVRGTWDRLHPLAREVFDDAE